MKPLLAAVVVIPVALVLGGLAMRALQCVIFRGLDRLTGKHVRRAS
jgi:hypothetical protein